LERDIAALEAEKAVLESELAAAPDIPSEESLEHLRERIHKAVRDGRAEEVKQLLAAVVDQVVVESRACIQPYFVAPEVRTPNGSRRRTGIEPAWELSPPHRF